MRQQRNCFKNLHIRNEIHTLAVDFDNMNIVQKCLAFFRKNSLENNYPRGSYHLSRVLTLKDIETFNVAKLRLFAYISLEFTRNRGPTIEDRITLVIDPLVHKKLFPRRDDFYEAIDYFIEKGILFKTQDKTYQLNIVLLNKLSYDQQVELGLKSPKENIKQ